MERIGETVRIEREKKTVKAMIDLYCHHNHDTKKSLCKECAILNTYAQQQLENCPMGENKPACGHCTIHCYDHEMRETIRKIMRFSGPRMPFHHPVLTIFHLKDMRQKPNKM
ncbi:MAG: nitrous oxide-stimulated promoter family protein [Spirochaetales bacterium]|nr:nitrous oxide-stimulated promoter family protein [Spirochaetales bacterium]